MSRKTSTSSAQRSSCPTPSNAAGGHLHAPELWSAGRCGSRPGRVSNWSKLPRRCRRAGAANPDLSRQFHDPCPDRLARATMWRRHGGSGCRFPIAERAPSIEELFAGGPHGGGESFEIGDPDLKPEKSLSFEGSLHHTIGPVHLSAVSFTAASPISSSRTSPAKPMQDSGLPFLLFRRPRRIITASSWMPTPSSASSPRHRLGRLMLISDTVHATIRNSAQRR